MQGVEINRESDARGSFCPGPLMELIRLIKAAQVGEVVAVISGDEGSKKDIPAWAAKAKQEFIGMEEYEGSTRFLCRKLK
jgi:tRNA 2-thiouridine synthesizing protein A